MPGFRINYDLYVLRFTLKYIKTFGTLQISTDTDKAIPWKEWRLSSLSFFLSFSPSLSTDVGHYNNSRLNNVDFLSVFSVELSKIATKRRKNTLLKTNFAANAWTMKNFHNLNYYVRKHDWNAKFYWNRVCVLFALQLGSEKSENSFHHLATLSVRCW